MFLLLVLLVWSLAHLAPASRQVDLQQDSAHDRYGQLLMAFLSAQPKTSDMQLHAKPGRVRSDSQTRLGVSLQRPSPPGGESPKEGLKLPR